jgi:hypothetical protein
MKICAGNENAALKAELYIRQEKQVLHKEKILYNIRVRVPESRSLGKPHYRSIINASSKKFIISGQHVSKPERVPIA